MRKHATRSSQQAPPRVGGYARSGLVACALIGLIALPGCRGGGDNQSEQLTGAASAGLGPVNGIEVRAWTIDPLGAPLVGALAAYTQDGGDLDPATLLVWRDHGFRLVEIPTQLVADLEQSLPHIDTVHRVWLGQPTKWSGLSAHILDSDGGALGGRPVPVRATLAVRSWIEPGIHRRPIRLELALTGTPLDGTKSKPMLLRGLLLSHRLEPGVALAIVPAAPEDSWQVEPVPIVGVEGTNPEPAAGPPVSGESKTSNEGEQQPDAGLAMVLPPPGGEASVEGPEPAGPTPVLPKSLGESMLITPGAITSRPPRSSRRVIVIVPASR